MSANVSPREVAIATANAFYLYAYRDLRVPMHDRTLDLVRERAHQLSTSPNAPIGPLLEAVAKLAKMIDRKRAAGEGRDS